MGIIIDLDDVVTSGGSGSKKEESFVATSGQTVFPLSLAASGDVGIHLDGVKDISGNFVRTSDTVQTATVGIDENITVTFDYIIK